MTWTKLPLCGACDDGWIVDPESGMPLRRCPCRQNTSPELARAAALGDVAAASSGAMAAAVLIIKDAAKRMPVLSSNDVRDEIQAAQVDGPVVGAAFARCVKLGYIAFDSFVPSTQRETHSHPVRVYSSLLYRTEAAS